MPFTEQVYTFDGFLRGGEDLELSLLCAFTLLGLLLLLAQKTSTTSATLPPTRRLACITNPPPLSRSLVTPQSITPLSAGRIVPQPLRI